LPCPDSCQQPIPGVLEFLGAIGGIPRRKALAASKTFFMEHLFLAVAHPDRSW
jgi:hypothetical protein